MVAQTLSDSQTQLQTPIPTQIVTALQTALAERLVAVVLFGSQARGDADAESDWDVLVIANGLPEKAFDRHLFLKKALPSACRGAVSMLARTPEEFGQRVSSLYLDIVLDGQMLYDPYGYAAEKLNALRQWMKRVEIYRERSEAGDLWRWQTEPTAPWVLSWGT